MDKTCYPKIAFKRWLLPILAILLLIACARITPGSDAVAPTWVTGQMTTPHEAPIFTSTPAVKPTAALTAVPEITSQLISPTPPLVPGAIARGHIEYITGVIGARLAGSERETGTAQYIQTVLSGIGYTVELQPFSKVGWVGEDEIETRIQSTNVVATKAGDSEKMIVIGAHYDSVDTALGADDNASGVAVLLELAETLYKIPTQYTLRFVAFGAEEVGLLGSGTYVERLSKDERHNTLAMINLDSVTAGDMLYVYSIEGNGAVMRDWALGWAAQNGFDLHTVRHVNLNDEDGYPTADYAAFQNVGIPYAYFEATNWTLGYKDGYTQVDPQYGDSGAIIHTIYDRLDYLDATFPGRVDERLNAVVCIVRAILTQFELPAY